MTGIVSSASYSMMPTISESELDGLQRHNINMQRSPYPGVALSVENRLNYHSSIMHLYHQQMNHPSIFTDNLPPLVPTNISSLSTVAQAYGIPNLHHVSMLGTEYQRQIRLQTERYNTATFSHLRGIPFQAEEFHQHMETSQTGPVDDANSINNAYNTNEEEEVDNNTCMSKADGDSGVNYPTEQQLYCNMEQKTDLSLQKNHQESGHLKAKISKKERKKSIPIIKQHKKIDSKWHASYEQLKQYKQKHGNTIVPRGYSLNSKLASWVAEQRKQYRLLVDNRKSAITPHRIKLLDELGFVWNAQEEAWRRQMKLLCKFHAENGHCNVQLNNPDYPKLGLWVKEQRRHYMLMKQGRPSHMTLDRFRQLSELDFCYDTHESTWQNRLTELEEFKRIHGNCVVSSSNANAKLAVWVHHQRRQYKKLLLGLPSHMSQDRMKALNDIGFVWFPRKKPGNVEQETYDSDTFDADDVSVDPKADDSSTGSVSDADVYCPPVKKRRKC